MIDLTKDKSEFHEIIKYPDGQQDVRLIGSGLRGDVPVEIRSRFCNWLDLEKIVCCTKSLRRAGTKDIDLYIPYFLGARSDRKLWDGGNHYLKDVIGPIINSLGFRHVFTVDPHSDVLEAVINSLIVDVTKLGLFYKWVLSELVNKCVLVSPDDGAVKRLQNGFIKLSGCKNISTMVRAEKHRDMQTGEITRTEVIGDVADWDCLIVDDICDGGRTFIELAKVLKSKGAKQIFLVVTHGIFSRGFYPLLGAGITKIFSTNSHNDWPVSLTQLEQYKII